MTDIDNIVRKNVRSLIPYSCARDEFQGKKGIFLDANENPFGDLNRYPDPLQRKLREAVSTIKNVPVNRIFLGNGSDEVIDLAFRIFCEPAIDKALTFYPTYGMYEVAAAINNITMIKVPLDENFLINFEETESYLKDSKLKLVLICTPNNPTGNCQDENTIARILNAFKGIVLLDEAYIDFSCKKSFISRLDEFPNLIVMQTFSKAFGMASARIGMAFSNPDIIKYFNKVKPPYNISTINQETVLKRISHHKLYRSEVSTILNERTRLISELKTIRTVVRVYPSDANFILVRVTDAGEAYRYLTSKGIVVRNRSSLIDNSLRITVGTKKENIRLIKALKVFKS